VTKELSPKQMLAVRCPTCGAAPGEKCELGTGQSRTNPHRDRRLVAKDKPSNSVRAHNRSRHVRRASSQLSHTRKYPKAAALAAGCDAYLVKPIDTREPSSQFTGVAERQVDAGD
jgi:hypothetical protein